MRDVADGLFVVFLLDDVGRIQLVRGLLGLASFDFLGLDECLEDESTGLARHIGQLHDLRLEVFCARQ